MFEIFFICDIIISIKGEKMAKEKEKKPFLIRLLNKLIITILVIAILFGSFYVFVLIKYDIDLFRTIGQVKAMMKPVDESAYTHMYTSEDMDSFKEKINSGSIGELTGDDETGYWVSGITVMHTIYLTEEECGAFIGNLMDEHNVDSVEMGENRLQYKFIQMTFDNIDETNHTADVTVVLKLNISSIKAQFNSFPANLIAKYIPDNFYISATAKLERDASLPFKYTITGQGVTINKLNQSGTKELLGILNKFASFGTVEQLSLNMTKPFVTVLIGDDENAGLAFTSGGQNYDFEVVDEVSCFVVEKTELLP